MRGQASRGALRDQKRAVRSAIFFYFRRYDREISESLRRQQRLQRADSRTACAPLSGRADGEPDDSRQRLPCPGLWRVVVAEGIGGLADVSPLGYAAERARTRLSIEAGDGFQRGKFHTDSFAMALSRRLIGAGRAGLRYKKNRAKQPGDG